MAFDAIDREYRASIRPLLESYCYECHADDVTEAEIDLAAFGTITDVRKQTKLWLRVRDVLDDEQMPPKDASQPTDAERIQLRGWVRAFLATDARTTAGDPGHIVLRRLSNAEYTYTIRDLTGVDSLDPTSTFPVDGAAGEGFTNTGSGQGMSPALVQKYLDAAKQVANHAMLLPDGIRFSPHTTRRDQTDQVLAGIQAFYRQFTDDGGGTPVNLQGIQFDTNQGGLLPLREYLAATLVERDALASGQKTIDDVARQRALNTRYLATLWNTLTDDSKTQRSLLIDPLREKWRRAMAGDEEALVAGIAEGQKTLWKFNSIGQFGREDGPKSWMEPVSPITTNQEVRFKLPAAPADSDVVIYLTASDLGDGNDQDFVVLQRPRIEFQAAESESVRPPILLRDVQSLAGRIETTIASESARTKQYLDAVAELQSSSQSMDEVAETQGLHAQLLENWATLAGLGQRADREIKGHFEERLTRVQGVEAINGWGSQQTPSLLTNQSDEPIKILTLTVPARSVTVHPSPTLESVVAWQSPMDGELRIEGLVADADNQCGNGAAWRLELLSETGTAVLASGVIENGHHRRFQPADSLEIKVGDVVSLVVNARDGSHVCDTTHIEFRLSGVGSEGHVWDLASDIVDAVLSSNPLPDSYGNQETWHFCSWGSKPQVESSIPINSVLAGWRSAVIAPKPADEIDRLAQAVQEVLTAEETEPLAEPDRKLRRQLLDWNGPLAWVTVCQETTAEASVDYGVDPAWFGKHPNGWPLDAADLCLQAPQAFEVRLPAGLAAGADFVTTGILHAESGKEGTVQLQVLPEKVESFAVSPAAPVLVCAGSQALARVEAAMREFRELFPPTLCYARIVPVDEVVTLTLFYREDDHLRRLMLDDRQAAELDRLWDELIFVSQEPLKLVVAFEQISEFATQDRPDLVKTFAPLKKPIDDRAEAFRQRLVDTEPAHLRAVTEFANRAWRRPLTSVEQEGLRTLYRSLRDREITHEQAIRLTLARVLTSPAFLYKLEQPSVGEHAQPVSSVELATRLSYFLWSSLPDDELCTLAESGRLTDDPVLLAQTRRMLEDPRARRLAIQFACQWLHVRDFDKNQDKNENLYPQFATLRHDMYEESVRFFEDMFRNDGSILGLLEADHTFLNESLADHYGVEGVSGTRWQRVAGIRAKQRGGVLGMATFLASQSGASRTSPILRGNWVYETLLGQRLPRPPAGVPQLPETVPSGLTARQLIEHHTSVPTCAKCHIKIDPYGFALEQYDAIGRLRPQAVDTRTTLMDGKKLEGIDGLRDYLLTDRRDDVVRQFCRKLLGYGLGREVQLSDEPLLGDMMDRLAENGYRFSVAVEAIVASRQFRDIRGTSFDKGE